MATSGLCSRSNKPLQEAKRSGSHGGSRFFLSCSFQFFKDWKEWVQLLYLDIQIVSAVRTLLLGFDDVTWCVAYEF